MLLLEYLMFYTPSKFLSECFFSTRVENSVDPDQMSTTEASYFLSIKKKR